MDEQTQNIYDSQAQLYKNKTIDFKFPDGMFEYFLDTLNGKKILDVWCAYWREVWFLRERWYQAYGIDFSGSLISLAESNVREYLQKSDIENISADFDKNSFDGIISSASLVHMDHDVWIRAMKDSYNILKKWWVFFLSLKVAQERKMTQKESISTPWSVKKYVYYWVQEIDTILQEIWFTILKTHSWKPWEDCWKILICKK